MAKKPKESRHTAKLRELGFVPTSETLTSEDQRAIAAMIERALGKSTDSGNLPTEQAQRFTARGLLPAFASVGGDTLAMDDMGIEWMASGSIDLSSFGFSDNIAWYREKARNVN